MKTARIYTNDFNRIIAATKSFSNPSSNRTLERYIRLDFNAELQKVTALAIDGYRMSVENAVISDCKESFRIYVKPNVKLPTKHYATFTLDDDEAIIHCGEFIFGYKQPKPEDFCWEKVIPTDEVKFRIGFNGNYLLSALQAAKISLGDSFRNPVILEFRGPNQPILLRTNKEDIKMVLPIRLKD